MNAVPPAVRAEPWKVALALSLVYLSWGTTYLATHVGVRTMPPALFGGAWITLAGLLLLGYLGLRGQLVRVRAGDLCRLWLVGCFMFVGGNWLINIAQKTVPSGVAAVLVATTPLWLALLERLLPHGERLPLCGWLGLLAGLLGVGVLWTNRASHPAALASPWGPVLVLASAFAWAAGSVVHRHLRVQTPLVQMAALQMILGGSMVIAVGLFVGELQTVTAEDVTGPAVFAFFYLLFVGSLVGFVAYTWLLGHVSAALAGTYAYVNPIIALFVGFLLGGEHLTWSILIGVVIILGGVGLVRSARTDALAAEPEQEPTPAEKTAVPPLEKPSIEPPVAFCLERPENHG